MSITEAAKERPIIFSGPMIKPIFEGRKTQTRRVIETKAIEYAKDYVVPAINENPSQWKTITRLDLDGVTRTRFIQYGTGAVRILDVSPYGKPGDRLWVREAFAYCPKDFKDTAGVIYRCDNKYNDYVTSFEWRPSIYMPRWASRILLEITGVRVERLQDISYEDIIREGWSATHSQPITDGTAGEDASNWYTSLWQSINGKKHLWESNPWVWVIEFRKGQS